MTPLDRAMAARAGGDAAAEMTFYATLRAAELFLLLEEEPATDASIRPMLMPTGDGEVALAFDSAARLADFIGQPGAFACLSGRQVTALLAAQDLALGLNLGTTHETLLTADIVAWLASTTPPGAEQIMARPESLHPPRLLPHAALVALDGRLAQYAGPGRGAWLVDAQLDATRRPLLVVTGLPVEAEAALAEAVAEAVQFSNGAGPVLDLAFVPGDAAILARLKSVALHFDIDVATGPRPAGGPPKLR